MQNGTVIFGASGLLGRALCERFSGGAVHRLPWSEIGPVSRSGRIEALREFLRERLPEGPYDWIFANGVIDARASEAELLSSNTSFPRLVFEATEGDAAHRYLTIGTIHERINGAAHRNRYFDSKRRLCSWVEAMSRLRRNRGRLLHIRQHTIYGHPLHREMFLGQIAAALREGCPFEMSSGEQLREYHHADDIALGLLRVCERSWDELPPSLDFNSGMATPLAAMAQHIFEAFQRPDLLRIGALGRAEGENTSETFERSPADLLPRCRDPFEGVVAVLREELGATLEGGAR